MLRTPFLSFGATALLTTAATAQFCTDNQYPVHLVSAAGVPAPTFFDTVTGETTAQFSSEAVYLAFDPALPSGTYYVHVIDPHGASDMVLSTNDPMDRFVSVTNTAGVITLSLPFTNNQTPAVFGLGLAGVGQSLLLQPFTTNPEQPCRFKAIIGDDWDLSNGSNNPYMLRGGFSTTLGRCVVRSYTAFRIGDGTGTDVTGVVFGDTDRDGVRDTGEPGLAGWEVMLVSGTTSVSATTDATGAYRFVDVTAESYTVELVVENGYVATTAGSFPIEVCGCADAAVGDFGAAPEMLPCHARPICFWISCRGLQIVQHRVMLPTLPALYLRNLCGQHVAPGSLHSFRWFLLCANSWNMANKLSAELLAMHCNVLSGRVHPSCVIRDNRLGNITIATLIQRSIQSLIAHPYTPPCTQWRHQQEVLKTALERANNNRNWL